MSSPHDPFRTTAIEKLLFVVVVLTYAALAFVCHSDQFIWDESRYVQMAKNLTQGFFVSDEDPDFISGPGYPLVLMPFVAADVSLVWARVMNGVFIALAAILLHQTLRRYTIAGWALISTLAVAFHPNLLRVGPYLMTEPLTLLCLSAFMWSFTHALRLEGRAFGWMAAAAVFYCYLTMTRVIFGHVLMVLLLGSLILMPFLRKWRQPLGRTAVISALAFALCVPYLLHTRAKTGKTLCWSTNSGELLYWMTSHNPGENGHWFSHDDATTLPELVPNHKDFMERVGRMNVIQREAEFTKAAKQHLQEAPKQFAVNWFCNIGRLFFGFPRSFQAEEISTLLIIAFNGPLLLLVLAAVITAVLRPASVPPELALLFGVALVYFGGSTLASGLPRYFLVITPLLWLFSAAVLWKNVRIRLAD